MRGEERLPGEEPLAGSSANVSSDLDSRSYFSQSGQKLSGFAAARPPRNLFDPAPPFVL